MGNYMIVHRQILKPRGQKIIVSSTRAIFSRTQFHIKKVKALNQFGSTRCISLLFDEAGPHYAALADKLFTMQTRLVSHSEKATCFCLPSSRIKGVSLCIQKDTGFFRLCINLDYKRVSHMRKKVFSFKFFLITKRQGKQQPLYSATAV